MAENNEKELEKEPIEDTNENSDKSDKKEDIKTEPTGKKEHIKTDSGTEGEKDKKGKKG